MMEALCSFRQDPSHKPIEFVIAKVIGQTKFHDWYFSKVFLLQKIQDIIQISIIYSYGALFVDVERKDFQAVLNFTCIDIVDIEDGIDRHPELVI